MQTRIFGRTGRKVTAIGFGAWPIGQKETDSQATTGSYGHVPPEQAQTVVERYVESGGSFIDTARAYGTSESIIGRCSFIKERREEIFLASKTGRTNAVESLPEIRKELETTLRNLNTDYLDLYQIHSPPEDPDLMIRVLDIFDELKAEGKIRAIGASVKGPDVTDATVELARQYIETGRVDALQLIYSMFRRRHEETFAAAAKANVAIIARTVLESGFLTGKYAPGTSFDGHRSRWGVLRRDQLLEEAEHLKHYLAPPYESLAQAAQKFALERPEVSVIIPGARTVQQVDANLAVDTLPPLPEDLRRAVNQLPERIADLANTGA